MPVSQDVAGTAPMKQKRPAQLSTCSPRPVRVEIAVSRYQQIMALEDEVADLADRFETRKLVDRAKSKLQTQFGMSEPEAFRWIQKTSMDKRLTMREVATTVISAGDDRA